MSKMSRACPVHLCLTRKCYIPNIGWASYKDVKDDIRRYGVIFLGFQMELFPIEVEYKGVLCGPYFLLTKRCMLADLDKTPYFFRTAEKRDNAISYITRE